MAYADHVPVEIWQERYEWLRKTEEQEAGQWRSILISPQGNLVTYDLEIAFCAGAWISVIILAHAAIDATLRDTDAGDYACNSKKLFADDEELQWLRLLRNRLVHVSDPDKNPVRTEQILNDVAAYQEALEDDAYRAMRLVYRSIYANPGT